MVRQKYKFTADEARQSLRFNPDTGSFVWLIKPRRNINIGDIAGGRKLDGYWRISIFGKVYFAHRLAWLMAYGEWPNGEIDHINGTKDDNRIVNLRVVSREVNTRNSSKRKDNASGTCGVGWFKARRRWRAYIRENGKQKHLGSFERLEDAVSARKSAEALYGYHENHGRNAK